MTPFCDECELVGWFAKAAAGPFLPPGCLRKGSMSVLASPIMDQYAQGDFEDLNSLRRWDKIRDDISTFLASAKATQTGETKAMKDRTTKPN